MNTPNTCHNFPKENIVTIFLEKFKIFLTWKLECLAHGLITLKIGKYYVIDSLKTIHNAQVPFII